jgi:hypothetical protein
MKKSKYFQEAREMVNEEFLGSDGWDESFDDEDFGVDAFGDEMIDAEGEDDFAMAAGELKKPTSSQPYIVEIENTTTSNVTNATILDAALKQTSYAVSGLSITYGISTITYAQFLASIAAGKVFEVGLMRLVASHSSDSTAESQVLTTVTITTTDINGNSMSRPFIPQFDSYQYRNKQVDISYRFLVDALTKIQFATIYGSATLKVYLYPASKVNQFKQLRGKRATSQYGSPKVNRALSK